MDKQYEAGIDPVRQHQQTAAGNWQEPAKEFPEAEKITLRLPSIGSADKACVAPAEPPCLVFNVSAPPTPIEVSYTPECDAPESADEIHLDDLSATDQILIETTNSFYSFTITEPKILAGRLIGGVLGNRLVNAALLPSWFANRNPNFTPQSFKVGSRLVFMVEWGNNLRQLTTSVITRLLHRKTQNYSTPAVEQERWELHESLVTRQMDNIEK